jgi:hypothetical protein
MGVGMNEANKLGGALAAVGVASRMIGDEANQKIAQGAQAQQEAVKVGDEIPNLKEEMDAAQAQQANVQKEEDALYGLDVKSPEDAEAFAELKQGIDLDKKMAKVALETVDAKIKARTELLKRADKAMTKGRAWGGTY